MPADAQLCTFYVGDSYFGIPVDQVQEVVRSQPVTPVPLAPTVIRGLINLRGQILTAIDLRNRLGLGEPGDPAMLINIVVRTTDSPVSFLVDEIGEVLDDLAEHCPELASIDLARFTMDLDAYVVRITKLVDAIFSVN
jgi:purine-binding chemotaxis protein CheW